MHPEVKAVLWKYMPLFIGVGIAAIVSVSIIAQVIIPCATGALPFAYCFGDQQWDSTPKTMLEHEYVFRGTYNGEPVTIYRDGNLVTVQFENGTRAYMEAGH